LNITVKNFVILHFRSSTSLGTAFTVSGVVILVTMTSNSTNGQTGLPSSFTLKFLSIPNDAVFPPERSLYPSTVVTGEGRQVVSFPERNAENYTNHANHLMLVSRANGGDFNRTLTFMDTEEKYDFYRLYAIGDDANKTRFNFVGT